MWKIKVETMEYGVKWRGVGREKYKVWQWQRIYIPEIRKQNPSPLRTGEWIWRVSTNTALLAVLHNAKYY